MFEKQIGHWKWLNSSLTLNGNVQIVVSHLIWHQFKNFNTKTVINTFLYINFDYFSKIHTKTFIVNKIIGEKNLFVSNFTDCKKATTSETDDKPNEIVAPSSRSSSTKLFTCLNCHKEFYFTTIEILKHKKKCKSKQQFDWIN